MAVSKARSSARLFRAFFRQAGSGQTYAPRPDFLPVASNKTSPSGVRTMRSSAFFFLHLAAADTLPLGYFPGLLHLCRSFLTYSPV